MLSLRALARRLGRPGVALALALGVGGGVLALRAAGWLQALELGAYDRMLRARPDAPAPDPRIAVIRILESDIRKYGHPLPDSTLARAFETLARYGARAVGADLYRDHPVPPGSEALEDVLFEHSFIVMAEKLGEVPPPPFLVGTGQVGFTDLKLDADGVVRRGLLSASGDGGSSALSLATRVAFLYLAQERIYPRFARGGEALFLGESEVPRFHADDGSYVGADDRGYQVLLDYAQGRTSFDSFSLDELLAGEVAPEAIAGRVVLVGTTAPSVLDHHDTPFGGKTFGVMIHAHLVSQLLGTARGERRPWRFASERIEAGLVLACALGGSAAGVALGSATLLLATIAGVAVALAAGASALFVAGWWLPVVPSLLAWFGAAGLAVGWSAFRERAEKRELRRVFGRSLDSPFLEDAWERRHEFMEGGRPRPQAATVTVLMSDLKGFTTASEDMEPEALMGWINTYMDAMAQLVVEHGGVVDNYIGDGLMADFGVPVPRASEAEITSDAVAAVECALAMGAEMERLNREWAERGLPTGRVRIGLNTGPVVVGALGSDERMKYTTLGDTVNTAARLEAFDKESFERQVAAGGPDFRVLVSEATFLRLGDRFESEKIGAGALKGKDHAVMIYRILDVANRGPESSGEEAA